MVHSYAERLLSVRYSFFQAKESSISGTPEQLFFGTFLVTWQLVQLRQFNDVSHYIPLPHEKLKGTSWDRGVKK